MISIHHNIGGWNTVYTATFLICAAYLVYILWRRRRAAYDSLEVIRDDPYRMALGMFLVTLAGALRIGGWIPWRALLLAENEQAADQYRDLSWLWTGSGAVILVIGVAVIAWPLLVRTFGRAVIHICALWALGLYLWGVIGTEILSWWF